MKNLLVASIVLFSANSFGVSQFTADYIKLKTMLDNPTVAHAFPKGIDMAMKSKIVGNVIYYAFMSGTCEIDVDLQYIDDGSLSPKYQVINVKKMSGCPRDNEE